MDISNRKSQVDQLKAHREQLGNFDLQTEFVQDPDRAKRFSLSSAGLYLDYSKNLITDETLALLAQFAHCNNFTDRRDALLSGAIANPTENRAALHTLIRTPLDETIPALRPLRDEVEQVQQDISNFVRAVHEGEWLGYSGKTIEQVVNIGIGGSDLGPAMVSEALTPFHVPNIHCHFVSNVDLTDIQLVLGRLDPQTTLFVISSKTFTTLETISNARFAREWLSHHVGSLGGDVDAAIGQHFVAVSAAPEKAVEFGIQASNVFSSWDWVGGRFSLWSATGLPIALAVGMKRFKDLLAGAHNMDRHFQEAPIEKNMPIILALLTYWYTNYWGTRSQAILPYDHLLRQFPDFLQQLEMESNGKSVCLNGSAVKEQTCPVIFGSVGTNGQHSFHQLLHQGTQLIPADFIASLEGHYDVGNQHKLLYSNCLAQSQALMRGKSVAAVIDELMAAGLSPDASNALAAHKVMPGNRPSNTLVFEKLSPRIMGALIALYEHKVFSLGILWQINSFDQWGVEYGKVLSDQIQQSLTQAQSTDDYDASTAQLIKLFRDGLD